MVKQFISHPLFTYLMVVIVIVLAVAVLSQSISSKYTPSTLGLEAVKYMYDFPSIDSLDLQMDKLKAITTDEVYETLTIDKTDRALRVYLKFNNNPVKVIPEDVTDSHIIYSLKTESIGANRKFMFAFEVNEEGKISKVREAELLDFGKSADTSKVMEDLNEYLK